MKKDNLKNPLGNILTVFAWITFAFAILTAFFTIFSSFSDEENGKELFGHKFLIVVSDSMSKSAISENEKIFFNSGDIVIIKTKINISALKEGDVISFFSENPDSYAKTLTHKIRAIKTAKNGSLVGFETYGINTGVSDTTLVKPENILGVYSGKLIGVGNIFSFLKTPQGYYLSVLAPLILFIVYFSIRIGRFLGERATTIEQNAQHIEQNAQGVGQNAQNIEHNVVIIKQLTERLTTLENMVFQLNAQHKSLTDTSLVAQKETFVLDKLTSQDKDTTVEHPYKQQAFNNEEPILLTGDVKESSLALINAKRVPFAIKLLRLDTEKQEYFNELHNHISSFKKVHGRVSLKGVSYRVGRKLLARFSIKGKTLKLNLALDLNEFNKNVYFQQDCSMVKSLKDVPFTVKVKSKRGANNAKKLVDELMLENNVSKNDKYQYVDAIALIKDTVIDDKSLIQGDKSKTNDTENLTGVVESEVLSFNGLTKIATKKAFSEKLLGLDQKKQDYFETLYNHLCSFKKVHSRVSFKAVSFRFDRKLLAKISIRGKTLKLYLPLDVNAFNKNVYFQQDCSHIKAYEQVPFAVKIKSGRGLNNAIKLIATLMTNNNILKNDKFTPIDRWNLFKI